MGGGGGSCIRKTKVMQRLSPERAQDPLLWTLFPNKVTLSVCLSVYVSLCMSLSMSITGGSWARPGDRRCEAWHQYLPA